MGMVSAMSEIDRLIEANRAYRNSGSQDNLRLSRPARGLVVLTCMDVRLDLFPALGLAVGDAHLVRNAGGRASPDAIRSLVLSTHLVGTREIGVIHHTDCALEGLTDEEATRRTGVSGLEFLGFSDVDESVRADVGIIRSCGVLPADAMVWGAVYEVDTGGLRVISPALPVSAPGARK
jgi:carbonic anhydrase